MRVRVVTLGILAVFVPTACTAPPPSSDYTPYGYQAEVGGDLTVEGPRVEARGSVTTMTGEPIKGARVSLFEVGRGSDPACAPEDKEEQSSGFVAELARTLLVDVPDAALGFLTFGAFSSEEAPRWCDGEVTGRTNASGAFDLTIRKRRGMTSVGFVVVTRDVVASVILRQRSQRLVVFELPSLKPRLGTSGGDALLSFEGLPEDWSRHLTIISGGTVVSRVSGSGPFRMDPRRLESYPASVDVTAEPFIDYPSEQTRWHIVGKRRPLRPRGPAPPSRGMPCVVEYEEGSGRFRRCPATDGDLRTTIRPGPECPDCFPTPVTVTLDQQGLRPVEAIVIRGGSSFTVSVAGEDRRFIDVSLSDQVGFDEPITELPGDQPIPPVRYVRVERPEGIGELSVWWPVTGAD